MEDRSYQKSLLGRGSAEAAVCRQWLGELRTSWSLGALQMTGVSVSVSTQSDPNAAIGWRRDERGGD